jgi:hypothetical protein
MGKISFTADIWTSPNQFPFMAITAHWIQPIVTETVTGPYQQLRLRADLIAFHGVPGRHTGEHLAQCFLYVTDRIRITEKVSKTLFPYIMNSNQVLDWLDHV